MAVPGLAQTLAGGDAPVAAIDDAAVRGGKGAEDGMAGLGKAGADAAGVVGGAAAVRQIGAVRSLQAVKAGFGLDERAVCV